MNKFIILISILIILVGLYTLYISKKKSYGIIILLNGTSSSGKSAILNELKKININFDIIKIDDWFPQQIKKKALKLGWQQSSSEDPWQFISTYFTQKNQHPYFSSEIRKEFFDLSPFFKNIYGQAVKGHNIIIDTVLEYQQAYKQFFNAFKNINVIKILIYCPLDVLLERVEYRNKLGIPEEMRHAFQSFEQFPAIFKMQENQKDQIVDTVKTSILKDALNRSIDDLIKAGIPTPYFEKLETFKQQFITEFSLNTKKEITLSPRHSYDLILNSAKYNPLEMAQKILRKTKEMHA